MSGQPFNATEIYYLPTYLIDNKYRDSSGECSLFVRAYELRETKAGMKVLVAIDVFSYPDDDTMVAAIEQHQMIELPAEAETDRLYVPEALRDVGVKVERHYGRIHLRERSAV